MEIFWKPLSLELRRESSAKVCDLELVRIEGVLSSWASVRSFMSVLSKTRAGTKMAVDGLLDMYERRIYM